MNLLTIEIKAWNSWGYFKDCFVEARTEYEYYGKQALSRYFDEDAIAKYEDIFEKSSNSKEFYDNLRAAWEKEYHHVANNYRELIDLYQYAESEGVSSGCEHLLPDTKEECRSGEHSGVDDPFAISKEFYDSLLRKVDWESHGEKYTSSKKYIFDDKNKKLYCWYMACEYGDTYAGLYMQKLDPMII